jgi:hypothetical protein
MENNIITIHTYCDRQAGNPYAGAIGIVNGKRIAELPTINTSDNLLNTLREWLAPNERYTREWLINESIAVQVINHICLRDADNACTTLTMRIRGTWKRDYNGNKHFTLCTPWGNWSTNGAHVKNMSPTSDDIIKAMLDYSDACGNKRQRRICEQVKQALADQ